MIRLTLFLCAGIFVMLLVAGEDRGQRRVGLMVTDSGPLAASPRVEAAATPAPAQPLNLPAQPVMQAPVAADPIAQAVAAAVASAVTLPVAPAVEETAAAADTTAGRLRWIDAKSVNVREGPSTEFPVLGTLARGEAVLVVLEAGEGWSRVRIEGDGIEGFVASRLLTDAQP